MSKRKRGRKKPYYQRVKNKEYVLENISLAELKTTKKREHDLVNYHWAYYSELALQRENIKFKLKEVLLDKCIRNYSFKGWQRAVKYKYSLHPLCSIGSTKFIGGRFNYGEDINGEIKAFPALYITEDKDTALQETLGQMPPSVDMGLSSRELALTNKQSETIVSVTGELDTVFDLTTSKSLTKFVNLTKSFKLSAQLKNQAKKLNIDPPAVVQKPKELFDGIMEENWRAGINLNDTPFNGQIFGHILYEAGVSAILYKSKLTKKECLSIFIENFKDSDCSIKIDDEAPDGAEYCLDSENYKASLLTHNELQALKK